MEQSYNLTSAVRLLVNIGDRTSCEASGLV